MSEVGSIIPLVVVLLTFIWTEVNAVKQPPNIIIIVADDLGWNDVGFHGSKQIPTPNIDHLAHQGVILNNYYVQQMCTPTRSALLTGRHPIHTGLQHGVIVGSAPYGLALNETILPQYLKPLGYTSRIVGKWHLGFFAKEYTPTYRGFDSHYGYWLGAGDYFDHTAEGSHAGEWGLDFRRNMDLVRDAFGQYSTELFTNESVHIINNHNKSKPLFLYLAHQAVHRGNYPHPLQAPDKYSRRLAHIKDPDRRKFAAMTVALDDSVGHVIKALTRRGMLENSLVLFTTDNGGPTNHYDSNVASNWPLRGMKNTLWEGGIRGSAFIWSPLLKTPARVSNQLIHVCDWIPTILSAVGGNSTFTLDGVDQWKSLSENTPSKRKEILHNIDSEGGIYAIRIGDFKLIAPDWQNINQFGWYPPEDVTDDRPLTLLFQPTNPAANGHTSIEEDFTLEEISVRLHNKSLQYRPDKDVKVNCGPKPANASTNCSPKLSNCLYHIPSDPCEYNNIADKEPEIVRLLYARMLVYNATAVQPKNLPQDPRGYPIFHNMTWSPWVDLNDVSQ